MPFSASSVRPPAAGLARSWPTGMPSIVAKTLPRAALGVSFRPTRSPQRAKAKHPLKRLASALTTPWTCRAWSPAPQRPPSPPLWRLG